MIQRIQTIYLVLAFICLSLLFLFPFSSYLIQDTTVEFNTLGFDYSTVIFPVIINVILSLVLSLLSILSFKNRKRQLLFNKLNYLTLIILIVFVFINFNKIESALEIDKDNISYGIGMFLPIVALVTTGMASRAIKKDEDLIQSMDRIR